MYKTSVHVYKKCIYPLDLEKHPENIMNIVTGQYGRPVVNVYDAAKLEQMNAFGQEIHKCVTTMVTMKKHV